MEILAWLYIGLYVIDKILMPFQFGKEREPYTPTYWLISILVSAPIVYMLFQLT